MVDDVVVLAVILAKVLVEVLVAVVVVLAVVETLVVLLLLLVVEADSPEMKYPIQDTRKVRNKPVCITPSRIFFFYIISAYTNYPRGSAYTNYPRG